MLSLRPCARRSATAGAAAAPAVDALRRSSSPWRSWPSFPDFSLARIGATSMRAGVFGFGGGAAGAAPAIVIDRTKTQIGARIVVASGYHETRLGSAET